MSLDIAQCVLGTRKFTAKRQYAMPAFPHAALLRSEGVEKLLEEAWPIKWMMGNAEETASCINAQSLHHIKTRGNSA